MSEFTATINLALPECLTLAEADQTLLRFNREVKRRPDAQVVLNAVMLKTFDSSAIAVLLELRRRLQAQGKTLRVSGWPRRLDVLASLYGVRELLAT